MGQCHEINADHIFRNGGRYYFKFAVANSQKFNAQQLRFVLHATPKERRGYLEEIIALLKRLDKKITVTSPFGADQQNHFGDRSRGQLRARNVIRTCPTCTAN